MDVCGHNVDVLVGRSCGHSYEPTISLDNALLIHLWSIQRILGSTKGGHNCLQGLIEGLDAFASAVPDDLSQGSLMCCRCPSHARHALHKYRIAHHVHQALRQSGAQAFHSQHRQKEVVIAGKGVKEAAEAPSNDCRTVDASWHCSKCCGVGLQAVGCSIATGQVVGHRKKTVEPVEEVSAGAGQVAASMPCPQQCTLLVKSDLLEEGQKVLCEVCLPHSYWHSTT
jgi:hypothetical protein